MTLSRLQNPRIKLTFVLVLAITGHIAGKQELEHAYGQDWASRRTHDVLSMLDKLAKSGHRNSINQMKRANPLKSFLGIVEALDPKAAFFTSMREAHSVRRSLHTESRGSTASMTALPGTDTAVIKSKILQIAALTDRGQRLNKLITPTYQEKRGELSLLVQQLVHHSRDLGTKPTEAALSGEWELVYSDVELFRSSPFFLAIEEALNSSPGPEWAADFERFLGGEEYGGIKDKRAELFFKLHQLQVLSWGVSTVGRISQRLDFESGLLQSSFDTTLFGLTVIPIFGWFKLLPTFGGRIVTEADGLKLTENATLCMELQRTKAVPVEGIPTMPLVWNIVKDKWFPVNAFWKLLPWNGGPFDGRAPTCSMNVEYVDENMRISRDGAGGLFVYMRPL